MELWALLGDYVFVEKRERKKARSVWDGEQAWDDPLEPGICQVLVSDPYACPPKPSLVFAAHPFVIEFFFTCFPLKLGSQSATLSLWPCPHSLMDYMEKEGKWEKES